MPRQSPKDGQVLPVHGVVSVTLAAGTTLTQLSPQGLGSLLTRLASEADNWAHFRWNSFKFRVHHGALTGDVAVGFCGGMQDTAPSTKNQVAELLPSTYYGSTYTKPSEWVNISTADLRGPFPWYKALNGTADTTEEAPGNLHFAGTGTDVVVIEVRGVIEFKTSVAPANTPMAAQLRVQARLERLEKEREQARRDLLRLLGSTTTGPK